MFKRMPILQQVLKVFNIPFEVIACMTIMPTVQRDYNFSRSLISILLGSGFTFYIFGHKLQEH
jgi:hypothetical protein